jgi:hypothetical protein
MADIECPACGGTGGCEGVAWTAAGQPVDDNDDCIDCDGTGFIGAPAKEGSDVG